MLLAWQEHSARAAPCGPLPPGDHRDQRQGQGALPEIRVNVGRPAPRDARPLFAGARGAGSAVGYVRARGSVAWPSARSGSGRREPDLWLGRWIARGPVGCGTAARRRSGQPWLTGQAAPTRGGPFQVPLSVGARWGSLASRGPRGRREPRSGATAVFATLRILPAACRGRWGSIARRRQGAVGPRRSSARERAA